MILCAHTLRETQACRPLACVQQLLQGWTHTHPASTLYKYCLFGWNTVVTVQHVGLKHGATWRKSKLAQIRVFTLADQCCMGKNRISESRVHGALLICEPTRIFRNEIKKSGSVYCTICPGTASHATRLERRHTCVWMQFKAQTGNQTNAKPGKYDYPNASSCISKLYACAHTRTPTCTCVNIRNFKSG